MGLFNPSFRAFTLNGIELENAGMLPICEAQGIEAHKKMRRSGAMPVELWNRSHTKKVVGSFWVPLEYIAKALKQEEWDVPLMVEGPERRTVDEAAKEVYDALYVSPGKRKDVRSVEHRQPAAWWRWKFRGGRGA